MNEAQINALLRAIGNIGDYLDRKLAHDQAELLRKLDYNQDVLKELLNTVRKSGPKGKIKLFVPILKQLGVDIAVDKDFKPGDVTEKLENLIYGENPTELKLK